MKKFIEYLKYFVSGLVFGIANVIPGVSGGTMLVVFGVFDRLAESISGIKKIIHNLGFLITFAAGAGAGILLSAKVIGKTFEIYTIQTNMFFIGLILGSVPLIIKLGTTDNDGVRQKLKPLCIVPFLIAMALVVGLTILDSSGVSESAAEKVNSFDVLFSLKMFGSAAAAAVTMIIPGISGSFMMMLLGVYQTIIGALNDMNFYIIIPFAAGAIVGIIVGAKLISILLKKFKLMVYSAIMGMVVGSVYAILPPTTVIKDGVEQELFGFNLDTGYGFAFMLIGVFVSVLIERLNREKADN